MLFKYTRQTYLLTRSLVYMNSCSIRKYISKCFNFVCPNSYDTICLEFDHRYFFGLI